MAESTALGVTVAARSPDRHADTTRLYALLAQVRKRVGGFRILSTCDGRMAWPRRGVYFFFEEGEERIDSGRIGRVVRIGTHSLKPGSGTSLWNRLSQHRGSARSGLGNHRSSIFRLVVGAALARRGDTPLPASWGIGGDPGGASRRLGLDRATVRREEAGLERRVSAYIGRMPFLWLGVDDPPGPESERGLIERNAISLLSSYREVAIDPPSPNWLGRHSDRDRLRRSGLWNSNHVDGVWDPFFLEVMERKIRQTGT